MPKKRRFTQHQLEAFKKEMRYGLAQRINMMQCSRLLGCGGARSLLFFLLMYVSISFLLFRIWSRLYHPNICLFMGAHVHPDKVLIVTEILEGDLESLLKKNKKLSLYTRMKMAKEAAQGVAWLHGQNPKVIHRDIKTSNFLYDKNYRIKVCDFGLSDLAERNIQDLSGAKGTLLYMAPEVMMGSPFNEKADVYSFGIVLWEILTFTEPFPHHTNVPGFVKAVAHEGERPVIPPSAPSSLVSLMGDCWRPAFDQRPTFIEICDRLDIVVIDAAVSDPQGNSFWKRAFFKSERVLFEDFSRAFYGFMGLARPEEMALEESSMSGYVTSEFMFDSEGAGDSEAMDLSASRGNVNGGGGGPSGNGGDRPPDLSVIGLKLLRALLASDPASGNGSSSSPSSAGGNPKEAMVHIFTFGKVLDSLGPLDGNFMGRMTDICSQKYFFGGISTEQAVSTLLTEPRGAFLVRFCNHPNLSGYFVLSKVTRQGKVIHIRIKHRSGGPFCIEGTDQEFPSLQQLVQTSQYLHLEPEKAASNSKFAAVFTSSTNQPFLGYVNADELPYAMELGGDD